LDIAELDKKTMSNTIPTQIPAGSTSEFHFNINSVQLNRNMSTVKFINKVIQIFFSSYPFNWK